MKAMYTLALAALVASPAVAGDQPVILPVPTVTILPYKGVPDIRLYSMASTGRTTEVASATAPVTAAQAGGSGTGAFGLGRTEADALYARLLSEAKDRGLR